MTWETDAREAAAMDSPSPLIHAWQRLLKAALAALDETRRELGRERPAIDPPDRERCHVCDLPVATRAEWDTVPGGGRDDLCWGGCANHAVDWRARYLAERAAHDETRRERDDERRHREAWFATAGEKHRAMRAAEARAEQAERERDEANAAEDERADACEKAERERDEALAALEALREAAKYYRSRCWVFKARDAEPLDAALAAAPAALSAQYRARVLREAANVCDEVIKDWCNPRDFAARLRALAEKEEHG